MTIEIDALYFMLVVEAFLIILVAMTLLARKHAKYKALYEKIVSGQEVAVSEYSAPILEKPVSVPEPEKTEAQPVAEPEPEPEPIAVSEPEPEPQPQPEPEPDAISVEPEAEEPKKDEDLDWGDAFAEQAATKTADTINIDDIMSQEPASEEQPEVNEGSDEKQEPTAGLHKVVKFQKEKIIDLMGYKDLFESAQKKLKSILKNYEDVQERFTTLATWLPDNEELKAATEQVIGNNSDLSGFVNTIEKSTAVLAEKFGSYDEQLNELMQQSDAGVEEVDEGVYKDILKEKEELLAKVKEFEDMLKEKASKVAEVEAQYEDLENEYMTLYRQQQQQ
ncbi:MAG: hypothetical protein HQL10_08600 [Nitrospirae bacterium]|nr:hypothetical protein [Nitrospirota bacterium]